MGEKRLNIAVVLLLVIAIVGIFNTKGYETTGEFLGISFLDDSGEEDITCEGSGYPESFPSLNCGLNEFDVGKKESCTWCFGCNSKPTQNKLNNLCQKIRDEGRGLVCPSTCPEKSFFGGVQCKDCKQISILNIDLTCVIHFKIECKEKGGGKGKSGATGGSKAPPTGGSSCRKVGQYVSGAPMCQGKCPTNAAYPARTKCGAADDKCECVCPGNGAECETDDNCPVATPGNFKCVKGCCEYRAPS